MGASPRRTPFFMFAPRPRVGPEPTGAGAGEGREEEMKRKGYEFEWAAWIATLIAAIILAAIWGWMAAILFIAVIYGFTVIHELVEGRTAKLNLLNPYLSSSGDRGLGHRAAMIAVIAFAALLTLATWSPIPAVALTWMHVLYAILYGLISDPDFDVAVLGLAVGVILAFLKLKR